MTQRTTVLDSCMPSGDGTVTDSPTQSAVDEEAAPSNGLDPDTAPDAAGDTDTSAAAAAAPESDPDAGGGTASAAAAAGEDQAGPAADSADAAAAAGRTVLDGPALENPEMHRATEDLQSSEDKIAEARVIADDLAATTRRDA
jgi:hypothetical protein